ncbi:hypothetical protein FIBSPDRAFT_104224 [Athelia psychrophila]|uniref:Uncharacterized protein n=1 Tax=Athelia psychrophila TaxID=1759441 RepID=A0A166DDJ1_9AGAM|nr:hypothetical protein FIBSPDRAFT_104224 [Fibularhizoctonia sp. CBS 109695]
MHGACTHHRARLRKLLQCGQYHRPRHGIPQSQSQYEELGVAGLRGWTGMNDRMGAGGAKEWDESQRASICGMCPLPRPKRRLSYPARPTTRTRMRCRKAVGQWGSCRTRGSRSRQKAASCGNEPTPRQQVFPSAQSTSKSGSTSTSGEARRVHLRMRAGPNPTRFMELGGRSSCSGSARLSVANAGTMTTQRIPGSGIRGSCGTPVA